MLDLLHGLVLREDPSGLPIMKSYTLRGLFCVGSAATRSRGVYAKLTTRGNAVVPTIRVAGASVALQRCGQLITLALA